MKNIFSLLLLFISITITAQPRIISGPMLGPVELRDAKIWVEVSQEVKAAAIQYNKKGETVTKTIFYKGQLENEFNPIQFTIGGLDFNTTYQYRMWINGKATKNSGEFTTKDLWVG